MAAAPLARICAKLSQVPALLPKHIYRGFPAVSGAVRSLVGGEGEIAVGAGVEMHGVMYAGAPFRGVARIWNPKGLIVSVCLS